MADRFTTGNISMEIIHMHKLENLESGNKEELCLMN